MTSEITPEDFHRYRNGFEMLRSIRHETGEKKYGELTFQDNDVIRMMAEELADTANYCLYQFAKLMKLQELLQEQHPELASQAFNGTKVGWTP